jgi:hypothetical protein
MTNWFEVDVRLYTECSLSSFRPIRYESLEDAVRKAEEYKSRWSDNCIVDLVEFSDDGTEPVPYYRDSDGSWKKSRFTSSFRV